jgi:uncharacterized protein (UPF0335 family)
MLKSLIERILNLEDQKKEISEDIKEIYMEARASGFDPKILRKVIAILKKPDEEVEEENVLIETYMNEYKRGEERNDG